MKKEIRSIRGELRAETRDGKLYVTGRAASYDTRSENLGWPGAAIFEQLERGCFDGADTSECIHAINHNPAELLGKTSSGTLTLTLDARGLSYKSELPNTTWARDLAELIRRGDASYSSFAFTVPDDGSGEVWSEITDPENPDETAALRIVTRVEKLFDVATLTGPPPAYPGTAAGLSDRFATMPAEIRMKLERAKDEDPDPDDLDEDPDDLCGCDCEECLDRRCEECSNPDCEDEACMDRDCPYASNRERSQAPSSDVQAAADELNELALEEAMED